MNGAHLRRSTSHNRARQSHGLAPPRALTETSPLLSFPRKRESSALVYAGALAARRESVSTCGPVCRGIRPHTTGWAKA